ncbi:thiamine diphosphokinase [Clostridiales bacterium FE2011]|nr:thiamine diphosphokinase [Clostridiales bacterium FE2011]QTE72987.1 thiamine diphosphokinase [Clostridiales bacterium FE2010]
MQRCVIVGGAGIREYQRIRESLRGDDWFVYCDGGLKHVQELGREPNLIVGDFDSHEQPETDTETIVLPCEKDDTDTVYAVKEAVRRGFQDFLLIGVTGERFDHTFGNISLLLYLDSLGIPACILDDYSEMSIISRETEEVKEDCSWFSLLNISGTAKGITIRGAKYPLTDGEITSEYQYGISNEVLPGETARVSVREGRLLLVKVFGQK